MHIITVDAGTTNTRSSLWQNGNMISQSHAEIGVRDTALTGSNDALKGAVRDTITQALGKAGVRAGDVTLFLASGMISSPLGLKEIPHLPAPAGLEELARGMQRVDIPEIFPLPLWIIPGVRNSVHPVGFHNYESMDMMRGEETEAMGLLERLQLDGPAMLIMPGSHTKFVGVTEGRRIAACATTLAGEFLHVLTKGTLLSQSLESDFAHTFLPDMVLAGAMAAQTTGLTRTCFSVRTLELFTDTQREERANFLLGAVLSNDVIALRTSSAIQMHPDTPIVIAGKSILRQALALLIDKSAYFYGKHIVVSDEQQADLAGFGALTIARERGLIDGLPADIPNSLHQPLSPLHTPAL